MAFLLEHMPAQTHVVIATRSDPPLPLARMRARGELVEIRVADLRFTPEEAAAYFNEVMGLGLGVGEVTALEGRTEGWIAALQLAGLSMRGRSDVAGFIAGFAGDDRYIVDYLVEEVLQRQTGDVRTFLLDTSILSRMNAQLCDAVTERESGREMLESLDRANLFIVPLDDRRHWYRYHHLFGDVLRVRLHNEDAARVAELHRRASAWYEGSGERAEAIRHAIAGGDFERAADLVELEMPITRQARQEKTLRGWMEALPDASIRARPVLSNGYAGSLLVRGETEGVAARLGDAQRWLDDPVAAGMVVADEQAFRDLAAAITVHRAGLARLLGDVEGTITHARAALDLVRGDDLIGHGGAAALLALATWTNGDLEGAYRHYADAMASLDAAGHLSDVLGCAIGLADIRIEQGRLGDAMRIYERGLALTDREGAGPLRGIPDMHVGVSTILHERGDRSGARRHLQISEDMGEEHGLPQNPYRSRAALARLRHAEGDLDGALELLAAAERVFAGDFFPNVRPIAARRALLSIEQGRLAEAWSWARDRGLSSRDDLTYLREFEHATLARLLLAQGRLAGSEDILAEARELLERLRAAAEAGGRAQRHLEVVVLAALTEHATGREADALTLLEQALELAEPESYVRVFLDEGAPMARLLDLARRRGVAPRMLPRLLTATMEPSVRAGGAQRLIEPLSERELEILHLLQGDLDGPGIARQLVVSLNTVRTHTKNIYAKLGVNSRRAAVRRAGELELLSRFGGHERTT
jgi:LuxR family maltose regulon positive regulatory protein